MSHLYTVLVCHRESVPGVRQRGGVSTSLTAAQGMSQERAVANHHSLIDFVAMDLVSQMSA